MKKLCLLSFLLIIGYDLFAQHKGYVIYSNHDTVVCAKVKKSKNDEVKFKRNDDDDDFETADAGLIIQYQLSNKSGDIYKSMIKDLNQPPVFMQILEDGKICLYEEVAHGRMSTYSTNGIMYGAFSASINWYINKNNQPLILIKTSDIAFGEKKRRQILADMFKDDPKLYSEFATGDDFSKYVIRGCIKHYNQAALLQK
jgi:hypothetical protein